MRLCNDVSRARAVKGRQGFTLIEIMMVIVIIALLTGLILGISGNAARQGDRKKALGDMEKIKAALEEYRLARNTYYGSTCKTDDATFKAEIGKYSASTLNYLDPWGRPFQYDFISKFSFNIYSYGPDGAPGNEDDVNLATGKM